jgi:Tol biopolymer transport system component
VDGKWVAYQSDESGKQEIYVQGFSPSEPGSSGKWLISAGGGREPRWSADGKELFYLAPDNVLMAVPVRAGATFMSGTPRALFTTRAAIDRSTSYGVTSDGRFLVRTAREPAPSPATVVLNWMSELKERVP